jgi:hypothetical protein
MDLSGLGLGDLSMSTLFAGFAFGVFGWSFLKIGRKDGNVAFMLIGITLMVFPYFVSSSWLTWGIGIALMGLAYKLRSKSSL